MVQELEPSQLENTSQGDVLSAAPMETLPDGKRIWAEKNLNQI
ncbi:hypothetical protein [Xenorhabdus doucetiae]|nr:MULTISPECIES: hypothetical protein [unclassified Xenorhabdus]